jgi:hypothetical protein
METQQTHCYATELSRYHGNAIECIGHALTGTKYVTIYIFLINIVYKNYPYYTVFKK